MLQDVNGKAIFFLYRHETVTFKSNYFLMNIQNILYLQSAIKQISTLCICKTIYSTDSLYQTKTKTFWNLNVKARTKIKWPLRCDDEIQVPFSYEEICMKSLQLHYVNHASKNPGIHDRQIKINSLKMFGF